MNALAFVDHENFRIGLRNMFGIRLLNIDVGKLLNHVVGEGTLESTYWCMGEEAYLSRNDSVKNSIIYTAEQQVLSKQMTENEFRVIKNNPMSARTNIKKIAERELRKAKSRAKLFRKRHERIKGDLHKHLNLYADVIYPTGGLKYYDPFSGKNYEKGVDVMLAVNMVTKCKDKRIYLFSADTDYRSAVNEVANQGVDVSIVWLENNSSHTPRICSDDVKSVPLNRELIRKFLIKQ